MADWQVYKFGNMVPDPCTVYEFRRKRPEVIAAEDAEIQRVLSDYLEKLRKGVCPHCGQPFAQRQVGRCVYAQPCGHRLYQG